MAFRTCDIEHNRTRRLEKTEGRGQLHHAQSRFDPNDRHGDEDQGGGTTTDCRGDKELSAIQE
eukprot:7336734-Heterocapsa_arctica.AAC.1